MKILVPIKRVPDTEQKFRVRADGLGVEVGHLPSMINPFDAIALEGALRLREEKSDTTMNFEIVAVSIGAAQCEEQLQTALAVGADRAIRVDCDEALDPWNVSRILQAIVEKELPDIVLMGKQAVDDDCNQTGQFLAATLEWPQATFATQITLDGNSLSVVRETDAGVETLDLLLPAVVTADLRLSQPRFATLAGILAAKEKTVEVVSLYSLSVEPAQKVKVLSIQSAQSSRRRIRIDNIGELASCLSEAITTEHASSP